MKFVDCFQTPRVLIGFDSFELVSSPVTCPKIYCQFKLNLMQLNVSYIQNHSHQLMISNYHCLFFCGRVVVSFILALSILLFSTIKNHLIFKVIKLCFQNLYLPFQLLFSAIHLKKPSNQFGNYCLI